MAPREAAARPAGLQIQPMHHTWDVQVRAQRPTAQHKLLVLLSDIAVPAPLPPPPVCVCVCVCVRACVRACVP